ncbi:MAG: TatD family hydrolase [Bacteroidaceae bacterium]|nr:TatD family hydrolase [Bacteroidaceae bacterium]
MNRFIDFHAHHPSLRGERVVQDGVDTWGLHPWHLDGWSADLEREPLPPHGGRWLCIGECGLDRACAAPYELQTRAFRFCIRLSERLQRPLVLHCVRAADDVLRLRREEQARQPWIWHGFRGGATQLTQLLPHGFLFSFGAHFRPDAVVACPADRLLLETDDTTADIRQLYETIAALRGVSSDELCSQMLRNFDMWIK